MQIKGKEFIAFFVNFFAGAILFKDMRPKPSDDLN